MDRETLITEAEKLLQTRDLRFYGLTPFGLQDSLALAEQAYTLPIEQASAIAPFYLQVIPTLETHEIGSIVQKLRKCPARSPE